MKKVYAVQDESADWYVIPFELKDKFFELDEKIGSENWAEANNAGADFTNMFSQYKIGGDLNLIEPYAEI